MNGILNDDEIGRLCVEERMIFPFVPKKKVVGENPSYGLTSFGYDIRLHHEIIVPIEDNPNPVTYLDPRERQTYGTWYNESLSIHKLPNGKPGYLLKPGKAILGRSIEHFKMPEDVMGMVFGKSTWARCFVDLNCTPLEPGWEGTITLEIANVGPLPVAIFPDHGIGQVIFFRGQRPLVPYGRGRYFGQVNAEPSRSIVDGPSIVDYWTTEDEANDYED